MSGGSLDSGKVAMILTLRWVEDGLEMVMVVTPEVVSDLVGTGVVDGDDLSGGQHAALLPGKQVSDFARS